MTEFKFKISQIVLALEMLNLMFPQSAAAFCPDYLLPRSFCLNRKFNLFVVP